MLLASSVEVVVRDNGLVTVPGCHLAEANSLTDGLQQLNFQIVDIDRSVLYYR